VNTRVFGRLCRARDLLRHGGDEPLSIRDIARDADVSPFHFIRQFEAVFGRTPHQYRIDSRIERAKNLLATGELSVTDVCLEVGFSSLGSFSTLFANRVGEAPSNFRRRYWALGRPSAVTDGSLYPGCLTLMWQLPAAAAIFEKHPVPEL
jgi:AraC-like DNA-binding protein